MRRRSFFTLALGAAALACPAMAAPTPEALVRRRLRFNLTFTNAHQHDLANQQFVCYLPAELGSTQRLHKVEASMAHQIETDALGHRILLLPFDHFPGLGQKVVSLTVEVHCLPAPPLGQGTTLAPRDQWLGAERFIESDASAIRALAARLKGEDETQTARQIYDWVRANLSYAGFVAEDRGALDALESGRGDCTEYADLVVALARASGLPARMVGGYAVDRDLAPRSQDYHNWAEIYLAGAWRMVDAQKENWLVSASQYIVYRLYRDVATNSVGLAHRHRMRGQLEVRL